MSIGNWLFLFYQFILFKTIQNFFIKLTLMDKCRIILFNYEKRSSNLRKSASDS